MDKRRKNAHTKIHIAVDMYCFNVITQVHQVHGSILCERTYSDVFRLCSQSSCLPLGPATIVMVSFRDKLIGKSPVKEV